MKKYAGKIDLSILTVKETDDIILSIRNGGILTHENEYPRLRIHIRQAFNGTSCFDAQNSFVGVFLCLSGEMFI